MAETSQNMVWWEHSHLPPPLIRHPPRVKYPKAKASCLGRKFASKSRTPVVATGCRPKMRNRERFQFQSFKINFSSFFITWYPHWITYHCFSGTFTLLPELNELQVAFGSKSLGASPPPTNLASSSFSFNSSRMMYPSPTIHRPTLGPFRTAVSSPLWIESKYKWFSLYHKKQTNQTKTMRMGHLHTILTYPSDESDLEHPVPSYKCDCDIVWTQAIDPFCCNGCYL